MQTDVAAEPCRPQRYKIFQPIELSCAGEARRAHLLDLSSGGALAHAETPPPVGARVRVSIGVSLGTAKVIWASGKRFGLAFNLKLSPAQIDQALAARRDLVAAGTRRIDRQSAYANI